MAHARHETIVTELQFAVNCLTEAKTLVELYQHEVINTKLCLQEADENIRWTEEYYRHWKLHWLSQDPTPAKTAENLSYSPSITESNVSSCTSTDSEAANTSHEFSQVADMNGTVGAKDGKLGAAIPLTAAALKEHDQDGSIWLPWMFSLKFVHYSVLLRHTFWWTATFCSTSDFMKWTLISSF